MVRKTEAGVTVAQQSHAIQDAMKHDVDFLIRSYLYNCQGVSSYEVFADLFKQMQMDTIFAGRLSVSEFVEFSENLLCYVASLIYYPEELITSLDYVNHEEVKILKGLELNYKIAANKVDRTVSLQISAIYLLYTLYFLQPRDYMAMIRISTLQMRNLTQLLRDTLLPDGELEAVYCVMRLVEANAFAVTPFERDFNPIVPYQMKVSSLSLGGPIEKTTKELTKTIEEEFDDLCDYQALVADSLDEKSFLESIIGSQGIKDDEIKNYDWIDDEMEYDEVKYGFL